MSMNAIKVKGLYIKMTPQMIKALDEVVEQFGYPSRNDAIRMACRDMILEHREFQRTLKRTQQFREFVDEIASV